MAGMAVSAATGVLSSLLSKLSELLTEQYMQRKGVRRDIEFLCRELTDMNAALEKLAAMEKLDAQTKAWRDKVREMAYDIEDSIDIFKHKLGKEDDGKDGLFHKIARKARELRQHYQLANKIQELRARVEEQSQSRDRYMIDESIPKSMLVEVDPRLPAMFEDAKRLVGIDGPREEVIKRLMEEDYNKSGRLKVLSVVGFGGLGKTTLVNQVYAKIKNEFECTAFVSVSRTPDMPKILKGILSGVGYGGIEMEDDVQKLIEILRATLRNKRYFVIIDDLWTINDWHTIECAFLENGNASRVITTTRNQDIGKACCLQSQGHVYQMQPLTEVQSRMLFFKRLFDTEGSCPEQFREISNQMLRKCKGVPLAITSIASLLANHMHIEIWEKIHKSLGSELDTNPTLQWMRHVLSLSYNDLSHELKTCLLYLGMYPEDFAIPKKELVRKWMAEGFVREKHGLDIEEAAENCFNELMNRCMIQTCFSSNGVWACQVHNLMLDLIISKCKEENFITIIDKKYSINGAQARRISHQFQDIDMPLTVHSMTGSTVRSYTSVEVPVSEPRVVEVDPRLPAMYEDAKRLVGIDGPREEIIKRLMEEDDNKSGRLKVLSVVGFRGLGKTTLVNQVYAKIKNEFECTAFVSVSGTPDMPKILKGILSGVGYGCIEMEDDVQKLIEILRATLTNKRYFVIIDDLWRIKEWDIIKCAFVENNNASRVITTTFNQDVATASCIPNQGHVYQMQPLNEIHSRRLFFKRLFDTDDSCPEQFREISNKMLRKCKGVPLAITSIASLLANHMHIEIWEKIHNSLGSELDTNPTLEWMRHVLSLSYNDLPHELKTCLLYLGMYPEDYEIPKKSLVRKWMAEGFVREKHGLDLEEAAENCFNELINRSMIQPAFFTGSGEVSACQVHDLMLDLIISKCKEENFITIIDNKYPINGASQVRRISHQFQDIDMPLTVDSVTGSTVRSYTSFRLADCMRQISNFEFLRVLDMERINPVSIDLSDINHLFLLRYVRVHGFHVKLPKKFGKLNHLMTLDMFDPCYSEHQSDFSSLTSLRHLSLPTIVTFKNGLSKLCNLRDLSNFHVRINSIECIKNLGELTNLRDLHVNAWVDGVEDNPKMTILAASLNKLGNSSNLRHLSIDVGPIAAATSAQFWSNCFTRPRHLQRLNLVSALMTELPNWIVHADRLVHAVLDVKELRSDDVQLLAQLLCLTFLELRAQTVPENNIIFHQNTFHSLKRFIFYCRFDLPVLTFEPATMPLLQRLLVDGSLFTRDACAQGAMQLQGGSPVGGIEHLASLEEISLVIQTKCGQWSKIESAFRDAVSRHPKSQAIKIDVRGSEYDENGKHIRDIRNTAAGTSGEN